MNQTAKSKDSIHRQPVYRTVLAVIGTGLLTAMAFPGYNQWYLAWVSLVPLLLTIRSASPREGFRRAYIAGFVFNGLILSWMLGLIYWAGSIVLLGISLLVAYMALYWAVFGWTFCRLRSFGRWYPVLFGPLVWAVLEYLEGKLFSGFGWGLIGHTQIADIAVAQCAAVGGVYLVSAIVVAVNICLSESITGRGKDRWVALASAVIVLAVSHAAGVMRLDQQTATSPHLHVGIVQGGFPIEVLYDTEMDSHVMGVQKARTETLAEHGAKLVVWSESSIPGDNVTMEYGYGKESAELARSLDIYLLAGGIRQEVNEQLQVFNSAFLFGPDGRLTGQYDKVHLAPFGEYVPFKKFMPFLGKIVLSTFDITPGDELKVFHVDSVRCGPLICFETVFPELSRRLVDSGAQCLISMSDLAWFGMSVAPKQEFAVSRFRAIENDVPLIRVANTGISAFVDARGRIVKRDNVKYVTRQGTRASFDLDIPVAQKDSRGSFYTRYGNLFILLSVVALVTSISAKLLKG